MRDAGWTLVAVLGLASVATAQPKPSGNPSPPTETVQSPEPDKKLKEHLEAWEKATGRVDNLRVEIKREPVDTVFKKTTSSSGVLLFMKPNFFIMRLDDQADPTKQDYEGFVCDGLSLYHYRGLEKIVIEYKLPRQGTFAVDPNDIVLPPDLDPNDKYVKRARIALARFSYAARDQSLLMTQILSGANPKALGKRFEINLDTGDADRVNIRMKPRTEDDPAFGQELKLTLFGPKHEYAYMPAQLVIQRVNGERETWSFSELKTNLPGLDKKLFKYRSVSGFKLRGAFNKPGGSTPDEK